MSRIRRSQTGHYLCWIAALNVGAVAATAAAQTACYSTPSAALDSFKANSSLLPVRQGAGYRVTGIQSDTVLRRTWAMVANCGHTEWPVLAIELSGPDLPASSHGRETSVGTLRSVPLVHAGDVVQLWKQEDSLRIEVAGVSEESGSLGKRVRVRLLRRNADDQRAQEQFSGIVRGPSDVEIQP